MKQKVLLASVAACFILTVHAQKKSEKTTAYAITSEIKGNTRWTEVKLVDLVSGEEVQQVYQSKSEVQLLNARTKKPIVKKDLTQQFNAERAAVVIRTKEQELQKEKGYQNATITIATPGNDNQERRIVRTIRVVRSDEPFATNSAACAYDKKHDRLYYTPMGINQLRYIDLKSSSPTIYYFEDEPLGALSGPGDIQNQVTRMVIASDGDGYALTNNAEHLIQFATNKKAAITDLGALTDDASNGNYSIHSRSSFGGDMVADDSKNLYLVTGNRQVFKIDIKSMVATYKGTIKGLPAGFTTNGAAVGEGNSIIVTSATNYTAYYKFSLDNMQAEKVSTSESVFNASDLANANLLTEKKKKKNAEQTPVEEVAVKEPKDDPASAQKNIAIDNAAEQKISVYPNPVSGSVVKISFDNYQAGNYDLQLIDLNGKVINTQTASISSKQQLMEYKLPSLMAKGTYLLKVVSSSNKVINVEKIIVQ